MTAVHANDPFAVAQQAVNELYVKPLHLSRAQLKITAETFPAQCFATAITIRVLVPTKSEPREVLKIDATIIDGKLSFLGASGAALRSPAQYSADEVMRNTIDFLSQLNGWKSMDRPPRRGTKKGYIELQMRDPKPGVDYEVDVKTIVFDEKRGVPVLIGAPSSPTANNCGDKYVDSQKQ
jgi:hypothetical protein